MSRMSCILRCHDVFLSRSAPLGLAPLKPLQESFFSFRDPGGDGMHGCWYAVWACRQTGSLDDTSFFSMVTPAGLHAGG